MIQDLDFMQGSLSLLMQKADTIHTVDQTVMYLGFCLSGTTSRADASWSICRITQTSNTAPYDVDIMWAMGARQKRFVFNDYAGYDYQYKNF